MAACPRLGDAADTRSLVGNADQRGPRRSGHAGSPVFRPRRARRIVRIVNVATAVAVEGNVRRDTLRRTCNASLPGRRCKQRTRPARAGVARVLVPDFFVNVVSRRIHHRSRTSRRTPLHPRRAPKGSSRDNRRFRRCVRRRWRRQTSRRDVASRSSRTRDTNRDWRHRSRARRNSAKPPRRRRYSPRRRSPSRFGRRVGLDQDNVRAGRERMDPLDVHRRFDRQCRVVGRGLGTEACWSRCQTSRPPLF